MNNLESLLTKYTSLANIKTFEVLQTETSFNILSGITE